MAKPGQPTKRTPLTTKKVIEALERGLNNTEAADYAGVCLMTLERWMKNAEFSEQIKAAKVSRKLIRLKTIEEGGKSWTASAWLLERSEPHKYGRPEVQLQINNTQVQPAQNAFFLAANFTGSPDPTIEKLLDSVPIELQNTPQPEVIESEMKIITEPQVPSQIYTCPQPAPPSNEGTSMRLLRNGKADEGPRITPKYSVIPPSDGRSADRQYMNFDSNDPL
jgi:hypothetical protein